jgi:hypothetical protein
MNRATRLIVFATVLLGGIIILLLAAAHWRFKEQRRMESHARARTQIDLVAISDAATSLALLQPSAIATSSLSNLDARTLYQLLSSTNSGVRVLVPHRDWDTSGNLLDCWGRPFQVAVTFLWVSNDGPKPRLVARCKLWSVGPNGKNENGTGDDVAGKAFDIGL